MGNLHMGYGEHRPRHRMNVPKRQDSGPGPEFHGLTALDKLYNVMVMERDGRTVFCGGESVLQSFAKAMNRAEKGEKQILSFFDAWK